MPLITHWSALVLPVDQQHAPLQPEIGKGREERRGPLADRRATLHDGARRGVDELGVLREHGGHGVGVVRAPGAEGRFVGGEDAVAHGGLPVRRRNGSPASSLRRTGRRWRRRRNVC